MKALILYDSVYGNTEAIAQAIYQALPSQANVRIAKVGDARPELFDGLNLLIVGSPTQRFRVTEAASHWLLSLSPGSLKGVQVTAFDTRLSMVEINKTPVLAFFVRLLGERSYGARYIANQLRNKGAEIVLPPEGFFVTGMKGPLVAGELERAQGWIRGINIAL